MTFFEPPPLPLEREPSAPQPVWLGPPDNVIAAASALAIVLARTDDVALGITGLVAFPTGFNLRLSLRRRVPSPLGPAWGDPFHHQHPTSSTLAPDVLRFGIQFSDGRKATTLDGFPNRDPHRPGELPSGPVLIHRGGSGGSGHAFDHDYWVWPLPPAGPLAFVCEWPAEGIALTRIEIDAGAILEAATRANVLWNAP